MSNRLPDGHQWSQRDLDSDGKAYSHRHCQNCGRDFASEKGSERWTAVYVGAFAFSPLEEDVNLRWLAEPCPGYRIPEDSNENRSRKLDGA
jgi:hypothetical protein